MGKATKASIVILLTIFLTPVISTIGVTDQHRWYLMLLTLLTPYTTVALTNINKKLAVASTLLLTLIGSAYPFTPLGYHHFTIWASASISSAAGYPWSLTPAIENISEIELVTKLVEANESIPTLVSFDLYPALHIFTRNPTNIIILQQVSLFSVVNSMKNLKLQKTLAVTSTNMTRELELLSKADNTIATQVKVEKLREDGLNVYIVEIENLD